MPSFTPYRSINSPKLRFNRQPNVFLLTDGSIVEGKNPQQDLVEQSFMFGHEPVGVSDEQAKRLLDYGFDLIPDPIESHTFVPPWAGSTFELVVNVPGAEFSRGTLAWRGASAKFDVFVGSQKVFSREVQWWRLEKQIKCSYVLEGNIAHKVEVTLSNESFSLPVYVAEWSP